MTLYRLSIRNESSAMNYVNNDSQVASWKDAGDLYEMPKTDV